MPWFLPRMPSHHACDPWEEREFTVIEEETDIDQECSHCLADCDPDFGSDNCDPDFGSYKPNGKPDFNSYKDADFESYKDAEIFSSLRQRLRLPLRLIFART